MLTENDHVAWIQQGLYLDAKDKYGDWQVGLILQVTKTHIKIRFDGWPSKYDEIYSLSSKKLKPFRSLIRGYTGQRQNPAFRQHWAFTSESLIKRRQQLANFNQNKLQLTQHEIIQYLRGQHYFYIDFLMTKTYDNKQDIEIVYEYFKMHINMVKQYLDKVIKIGLKDNLNIIHNNNDNSNDNNNNDNNNNNNLNNNNNNNSILSTYLQSYFELFDGFFTIIGGQLRLCNFFKNNDKFLKQLILPETNFEIYMTKYVQKINLIESFEKILLVLKQNKNNQSSISFLRSIFHLYAALDKLQFHKQKKKELSFELYSIIKQRCSKIDTYTAKNDEKQFEELLAEMKKIYFKYVEKDEIYRWIEFIRMNLWCLMIQTDLLEKKLRGISRLKQFYENLSGKNQYEVFKTSKNNFKQWIEKYELLKIIFEKNQHPQFIKKACQFAQLLYEHDIIQIRNIIYIWDCCKMKHQALKKIVMQMWTNLVYFLKNKDISIYTQIMLHPDYVIQQQWQIQLLFKTTAGFIRDWQSLQVTQNFVQLAYQKVLINPRFISEFAKILNQCQQNTTIISDKIKHCFRKIKQKLLPLIHLELLIEIINESFDKQIQIPSQSIEILIQQLRLSSQQNNRNLLTLSFKLLDEILCYKKDIIILSCQQFNIIWDIFSSIEQLEQKTIFYQWIMNEIEKGLLNIKTYQINSNFTPQLRQYIFNNILSDSKKLDYFNNTLYETELFIQFMIYVNCYYDNCSCNYTVSGKRIFKINNQELYGNKSLWSLFLNCKNEKIIYRLAQFMRDIYLNMSDKLLMCKRIDRINMLLIKINQYAIDGMKKKNIKLMKYSLILLIKILYNVKEKIQIPYNLKFSLTNITFKIKVYKNQTDIHQIEVNQTQSLYSIKNRIAILFNLPIESFVLLNDKQQMPKQWLQLPFFALHLKQKIIQVIIIENQIEKFVLNFIYNNTYNSLIELLCQQSVCQNAYNILQQIPIEYSQNTMKIYKCLQNNIKNINEQSNSHTYNCLFLIKIFNNLLDKIEPNLQIIQLFIHKSIISINSKLDLSFINELINILIKIFIKKKQIIYLNQMANQLSKTIINTLITLLEYFRNIKITNYQKNLCLNCIKLIQLIVNQQMINFIVNHNSFEKLFIQIFLKQQYNTLKNIMVKKMIQYMKNEIENMVVQKKLIEFTLNSLYKQITINISKHRFSCEYSQIFKFIKHLILIMRTTILDQMILQPNDNLYCSFLNILELQNDTQFNTNYLLQGHLYLLEAIYTRRPELITIDTINYIIYNCLFYDVKRSKQSDIKCKYQVTIKAALSLLLSMSTSEFEQQIVCSLTEYHMIKYWRTEQYWTVIIKNQIKSKTGYVGLKNPGCICYMNSLIQQLFMIGQFKQSITSINNEFIETNEGQLLQKMKLLFLKLLHSEQHSILPLFFSKAIKNNQNKPIIKIYQQMDIDEFCAILFDKIQCILQSNNNFIRKLFGGIYSNEIISKDCIHSSERQQQFLSVSLDVKKNINQSFQALIKGQILQGQNAYYCQRCDKKVRALKRLSLKKLPVQLIISLKRFQFDYEVEAKIKRNDYCQFPTELNLYDYSLQSMREGQENSKINQQLGYEQLLEEKQGDKTEAYFKYKLKGVVVHSGSADSGHYYSFISDHKGNWFEFNDERVCQFDFQKLPEQAYGGMQAQDFKVKNAYLLFYERIEKQNMIIEENNGGNSKILAQINQNNKNINKFHLLFSQQYQQYLLKLRNRYEQKIEHKTFKKQIQNQIISHNNNNDNNNNNNNHNNIVNNLNKMNKYFISYYLFIGFRLYNINNIFYLSDYILKLAQRQQKINLELLNICSLQSCLQEYFICCSNRDKCKIFANFIVKLVEIQHQRYLKTNIMLDQSSLMQQQQQQIISIQIYNMLNSILKIIVKNVMNVSQLCLILRKLLQLQPKFSQNLMNLMIKTNTHEILLDNIFGTNLNKQAKAIKLQQLTQLRKNINQTNQKQQQDQLKCFSTQVRSYFRGDNKQAWHILYLLMKWALQSTNQNYKIYQQTYEKLISHKISKYTSIIQQCSHAKWILALASFMILFSSNNQVLVDIFVSSIQKSLKDQESIKYRPFLLLLYYFSRVNDSINQFRVNRIITAFRNALSVNDKYFIECDLMQQWLLKCISQNEQMLIALTRQTMSLNHYIYWISNKKVPSLEVLKKHRNMNCDRLLNNIHGVIVSTSSKDYQNLSMKKSTAFEDIKQQEFKPLQYPIEHILDQFFQVGTTVYEYSNSGWLEAVVKEVRYGLLKIQNVKGQISTIWESSQRVKQVHKN